MKISKGIWRMLAPDTGNSTGGGTGDDSGHKAPGESAETDSKGKATETTGAKTYSEEEFQREVDRRITDAVAKRDAAHKAAEEKRKADEEAELMKKQGEYEALAKKREEERDAAIKEAESLKPHKERADAADKIITDLVAAQVEELKVGDEVKELLADKSPLEQLDWLNRNRSNLMKKANIKLPDTPASDKTAPVSETERAGKTYPTWK